MKEFLVKVVIIHVLLSVTRESIIKLITKTMNTADFTIVTGHEPVFLKCI